jgi:predicted pyridoxine 5'-phosphate oxidase superfamily flavin-nucleotide-binding protein
MLVFDDRTLVLPERPGNGRVDALANVLSNPWVGLLFLVPGRVDTLRVQGRGRVLKDAPFFDRSSYAAIDRGSPWSSR